MTAAHPTAGPTPQGSARRHVREPTRWAAVVTVLLAVAFSVACVLVDLATPSDTPGVRVLYAEPGSWWVAEALVLSACAAVVLLHDSRQRVGWLLAGFGLFWALDALSQSWVRYAVRDVLLPGAEPALWFVDRLGAFLPLGMPLLFLLYPTGRFLPGRWGTAGRVSVGLMCSYSALFLLAPGRTVPEGKRLPAGLDLNPTALPVDRHPMETILVVVGVAALASLVVPVATVVVRFRQSRGEDHDRMRWLLWGLVAELLVLLLATLLASSRFNEVLFGILVAVPGVAVTIGLVRPRLVPIEALLGTTIVYGALAVVLVGMDLLVLAGLTALLGDALEQRQVVVLVLLLSALCYGPLREWLRRLTHRLVLGHREDRYDLVAGLASRLEEVAEPDDQLAAVAAAVAAAFRVSFVSVEVDRSGGERTVVTYGRRPEATRSLPITYRRDVVGRLVLPAHGVRAHLSKRDEQLLGDLVRQAATAARTGRLAEELQKSRERLVLAREEERRRIRRDLHDGLGPALSGVVFRVDAARMRLAAGRVDDSGDGSAGDSLVAVREDVQQVISDVRRLVHDLRPPALDDLGLVGALREQAETASAGGLAVTVKAHGVTVLPAAVEVAAFRIIGEAMTNTVRHAGATRCQITLSVRDDRLVLEVVDDGTGIPADAVGGVGLASLRERAAELGGSSEVSCPATGGTTIRATLPLRRPT